MVAAQSGHFPCVRLLLDRGADIHAKNEEVRLGLSDGVILCRFAHYGFHSVSKGQR